MMFYTIILYGYAQKMNKKFFSGKIIKKLLIVYTIQIRVKKVAKRDGAKRKGEFIKKGNVA